MGLFRINHVNTGNVNYKLEFYVMKSVNSMGENNKQLSIARISPGWITWSAELTRAE